MNPYVVFLLYLLAILGFVAITLTLNSVLGPKPVASALKLEPFECGATPVATVNVKAVPVKYFAVAIVFILFDLETVFLYIWALGAQPLSGFMLFTYFVFMALLVLILLKVYEQMCEPKWVMAFGVCATSGGFYQNYAALPGIDRIIPVDIYIPGCSPRPEMVIDGIMQLQAKIAGASHKIVNTRF